MTNQSLPYHQMVVDGINGLPPEMLAEIVDFIYFVRKRKFEPLAFSEDLRALMLHADLRKIDEKEASHLEKEFESYDERYSSERSDDSRFTLCSNGVVRLHAQSFC